QESVCEETTFLGALLYILRFIANKTKWKLPWMINCPCCSRRVSRSCEDTRYHSRNERSDNRTKTDESTGWRMEARYGVDKIYKMEEGLKPSNSQCIFLVSNSLIVCKRVLDQIQSEISLIGRPHVDVCHHLLVMPFVPPVLVRADYVANIICRIHKIRRERFVLGKSNIYRPLLSQRPQSSASISVSAQPLIIGSPKLSLLLGKHSQQMSKLMESMEQSLGPSSLENEIGALIVMNRGFDLATSLLTLVTYARGLLNEVVEVNVGMATLEKSQTRLDPNKDQIYGEVRDMPCSEVFPILHGKAKSLKSEQEAIRTMKLTEMERYLSTRLQRTRDTELTETIGTKLRTCVTMFASPVLVVYHHTDGITQSEL
ncbi:Uncharacterized protein DBV15_11932, partial [Temnothorax longispinosus]